MTNFNNIHVAKCMYKHTYIYCSPRGEGLGANVRANCLEALGDVGRYFGVRVCVLVFSYFVRVSEGVLQYKYVASKESFSLTCTRTHGA